MCESVRKRRDCVCLYVCLYMCANDRVMIMITFKGAIRDFLQSPHCATNCLQHICSSSQGAIVCKSCARHRAIIACNTSCGSWESSAIKFQFKLHFF